MDRLGWMGLGALVALGAAAQCGYPDYYVFTGTGGAGGAASSASSSTGPSASSTGSSSPTASSSTGSSSSGAGPGSGGGSTCMVQHPGGGTCEYWPGQECGCSGSMKCSVIDEATGRSGCVPSGSAGEFELCGVDSDCAAGLWCNHATQACQPICQSTSDCAAEGGLCEPANQPSSTTPIPGLDVCAAHCDLITALPCGTGLTCVYAANKEFECIVSGGNGPQKACSKDSDCEAKLGCFDDGLGTFRCFPWCTPTGKSCAGGGYCYALNPAVQKGSTSYGTCQ